MIKKTLLMVISMTVSAGVAFADWTLMDDMTYADQDAFTAVWSPDPLDVPADPDDPLDGEGGGAKMATDPTDASNDVLEFHPGVHLFETTSSYNSRAVASFPEGSEIDALGTVYFRFMVPNVDIGGSIFRAINDLVMGPGWRMPQADPEAPDDATEVQGVYDDFSAIVGIRQPSSDFQVYDNGNPDGSYQTIMTGGPIADEWVQVWMVLDQANSRYKIYVQGGHADYAEQKLAFPPADDSHDPVGWAGMRAPNDLETLKTFIMYGSAGDDTTTKGEDPMYVDDLYIDNTGENLSSPMGSGEPVTDAEFLNISTRGKVGTGAELLIGGFVVKGVEGADTGTVLLRAVGPTLADFGVTGVLEDPVMEIFNQADPFTVIASNDDWGTQANADEIKAAMAAVGAFALPDDSKDAVLMVALPPGSYTAQVSGKDTTEGVAIIEVYAVD